MEINLNWFDFILYVKEQYVLMLPSASVVKAELQEPSNNSFAFRSRLENVVFFFLFRIFLLLLRRLRLLLMWIGTSNFPFPDSPFL